MGGCVTELGLKASRTASRQMHAPYIAGFFDGDGTIYICRTGRHPTAGYVLKAEVSQCNRRFLEMLNARLGGVGKLYEDKRSHKYAGENNFSLRFCGRAARDVLCLVRDHGIIKAEQARLGLQFLDTSKDAKEDIRVRMRALNRDKSSYSKPYDRMCDAYIAGLFDAEGNVYVGAPKTPTSTSRRVYVKITQKSDPGVLQAVSQHLGVGKVVEGCRWKIYSKAHIRVFATAVGDHVRIKGAKLTDVASK